MTESPSAGQQKLPLNPFYGNGGLTILQRNFRCRMGEIDLVLRDADCLVFTEVRFRRLGQHGSGAESITHTKRRKLITCASWYLRSKRISSHQACRFDVVSVGQVKGSAESQFEFDWIQNAFLADN